MDTKYIGTRISPELSEKLSQRAKDDLTSESTIMRQAISQYLRQGKDGNTKTLD